MGAFRPTSAHSTFAAVGDGIAAALLPVAASEAGRGINLQQFEHPLGIHPTPAFANAKSGITTNAENP
jgi:hypothetical protein